MQEEINSLESKLDQLINKIDLLKDENGSIKPRLHQAEEEVRNLKAKINEATIKIENLLGQIPD
jgi:uncharacterized protein (TIGR02449 family)